MTRRCPTIRRWRRGLGWWDYWQTVSGGWTAGQGLPTDRVGPRGTAGTASRIQRMAWARGRPGEGSGETQPRDSDQIDKAIRRAPNDWADWHGLPTDKAEPLKTVCA